MCRDIWLIFCREMTHRLRYPVFLIMGLAQPLLYMFFFGPLLTKYVDYTPGFPPGSIWTIFAPALMLQMVLIGSTLVGVGLISEHRSGVLERFRVSPIMPGVLLLGKVGAVMVNVLIQSSLIVLLCHVVFDVDPPWYGLTCCMLIVATLSVTLSALSYALALRLKNAEGLTALLNALLLPLLLLSGTLLPITAELAPGWLYWMSRIDPVAYVMEAARASFRGDFGSPSLFAGVAILVAMATASLWFGMHTFRHKFD